VKAPEQRQLAPNIVKAPALIKIQAQALLEAETGIRDVPMLMVIMHGLKAGEVQRLNISDYDGQSLVVRKARSVRRILLSPITNQAMGFYLDWRESTISRLEQGAPLFISLSPRNYGSRLGYHGFYKKVKKISGLAGSPSVTPEHFRQTFASQLAAVEAQFLDAMDLMGYESPCSYRRFARHYSTPGATMAEVHSIAL
jgi:integrase